MSKLDGKVAVVTGASKGIGAGIAKVFAVEGAAVIVNFLSSKEDADKIVAEIDDLGGRAVAVRANVSNAADAQTLVEAAIQNFGKLDILVNNCGTSDLKPLEAVEAGDFHRVFDINVLGPILVTQAAVKHLRQGASVINIGSGASRITPAHSTIYTSSKAAVDALTGVWAREFGPRNIRVNSINPGLVETEGSISKGYIGSDFEKWMIAQAPLGRTARVGDISSIALFLASDESGWLTGEVLLATGGVR
ncbi:MAG TPA: glucose 1-dehydrogenase [Sphingomicrobium sp.]|nr:glucose 1-dehydrogenase [Sphingomicrobium sp.]